MHAHTRPRTGICTCRDGNKDLVGYIYLKQAHDKLEIFLLKSVGTIKLSKV